jgi:CxxC motif-containing protein (DUF1111 family)
MRHNAIAGKTSGIGGQAWLTAACLLVAVCSVAVAGGRGPKSKTTMSREFYEGRELFVKTWELGTHSPTGGDGLGPLYNEQSCVACHHLGGVGGGGGNDRNVRMLTAIASPGNAKGGSEVFVGELGDLHDGFRRGASIVLHRHATAESLMERLRKVASYKQVDRHGEILDLTASARNTPAIFGAGLIDSIPGEVLVAAEERRYPGFPEIKGRVSRLPDGRFGRFGWKGQTAALGDFVLAACSNELGLEVPGHPQASLTPVGATSRSETKLDLDDEQCDLLIRYVRALPPPVLRTAPYGISEPQGYVAFETIGCATCHTPRLGQVNGLYSDLLLHDMGPSLGDVATYYGSPVAPQRLDDIASARARAQSSGTSAATEWRTPPLWGVADSAPYLHDGRARTLDEAVRLHGGEAAKIAVRYSKLDYGDRQELLAFLHSLTAAPKLRKRSPAAARREADRAKHAALRKDDPDRVEIPGPSGKN